MRTSQLPKKFYLSITGLETKGFWATLIFWRYAIPSKIQSDSAPGCLFSEVRTIQGVHHTLTAWESREHLRDYLTSGSHLKAMRVFSKIASGKTLGYEKDRIPDREEVHRLWREKVKTGGRPDPS
jgi:hypothetical protein